MGPWLAKLLVNPVVYNRGLTQQEEWKTLDGKMTKRCRARPEMHSLARHFFRHSAVPIVLRKYNK